MAGSSNSANVFFVQHKIPVTEGRLGAGRICMLRANCQIFLSCGLQCQFASI